MKNIYITIYITYILNVANMTIEKICAGPLQLNKTHWLSMEGIQTQHVYSMWHWSLTYCILQYVNM